MADGRIPPQNVVVDLIEGIPVRKTDTLEIYKGVLTSLLDEMPPGWDKVWSSHISRDRPIPDDMQEMKERRFHESSWNYLGVKLLSWGPSPNYHLRPGQTVKVEQFKEANLRESYVVTKALIKMLKLPLETYLMKKSGLGSSSYRPDNQPIGDTIWNMLVTPELFSEFSKYVKIEEITDEFVPLTEEGQKRMRDILARRNN